MDHGMRKCMTLGHWVTRMINGSLSSVLENKQRTKPEGTWDQHVLSISGAHKGYNTFCSPNGSESLVLNCHMQYKLC